MQNSNQADIVVISFSDPNKDSRALNFVNTLIQNNLNVSYIGLEAILNKKFISKKININKKKRFLFQWLEFYRNIKEIDLKGKIFLASDLYSLPSAVYFAKKHKAKVIYDSREIYSELGPLSGQKYKQEIISRIEKHYIKYVDEVIVSGKLDAQYLREYFKHTTRYSVIMNVPPKKEITKSNFLRDKFNLKNKKIIIYQGAILKGRGIESSIDAFADKSDYALVIIGAGPQLDNFREKYSFENIIFTGAINYDNLLKYTSSADLGIALFEDISFSYKLALPNKLFEYAMAGIPVIASDLPAINQIYDEFEFGKLLKYPFHPDDIYKASDSIMNEPFRYKDVLKLMSDKYNYENEQKKIQDMMNRLLK
jgi:glycosyltransferase involved in cell wall biosynthesis